jgi:predicted dehydrogenase
MEDIARVIRVARTRPALKLMYGFNHRYHESVQEALKIVRSGQLGRVINLRGVYGKSKLITFNQPDWRTKRAIAGGGVLLDQGIHMVDLMRLFAGEFAEVHSFISNSHWGYDVEDNAYALLRTEDGVVGMLNSSATQWRHRFNLDINLERGSVILGGILSGSKSYGAETLTLVAADPDNDNGDPKEHLIRYNRDPSWDEEITVFANAVRNDIPIESGSVDDAFQTMELVYKIYYADPVWREAHSIPNPDEFRP